VGFDLMEDPRTISTLSDKLQQSRVCASVIRWYYSGRRETGPRWRVFLSSNLEVGTMKCVFVLVSLLALALLGCAFVCEKYDSNMGATFDLEDLKR
jgi:hypothetical protein